MDEENEQSQPAQTTASAFPAGRLNKNQQKAALAFASQQRAQQQAAIAQAKMNQNENHFEDRQDLKERQFQNSQDVQQQHLSLAQQAHILAVTKEINDLTKAKWELADRARKELGASDAIQQLSGLDVRDPDFEKQWWGTIAQHSHVMDDPGVKRVMDAKQAEHKLHQDALLGRDLSTYTGQAAQVYQSVYAKSRDAGLANKYALAFQEKENRVTKALASPDLSNTDIMQVFNPKTNSIDLDAAERLVAVKAAARASTDARTKQGTDAVKIFSDALDVLNRGTKQPSDAEGGEGTTPRNPDEDALRAQTVKALTDYTSYIQKNGVASTTNPINSPAPAPGTKPLDHDTALQFIQQATQNLGAGASRDDIKAAASKLAGDNGFSF